jgi:hypothetical protein
MERAATAVAAAASRVARVASRGGGVGKRGVQPPAARSREVRARCARLRPLLPSLQEQEDRFFDFEDRNGEGGKNGKSSAAAVGIRGVRGRGRRAWWHRRAASSTLRTGEARAQRRRRWRPRSEVDRFFDYEGNTPSLSRVTRVSGSAVGSRQRSLGDEVLEVN